MTNEVKEEKLKSSRIINIKEEDGTITKIDKYILFVLDDIKEEEGTLECYMAINDLTSRETELLYKACNPQLVSHIKNKKLEKLMASKKFNKFAKDFIDFLEEKKKRTE